MLSVLATAFLLGAEAVQPGLVGLGGSPDAFRARYGPPFRTVDATLLDYDRCPGRRPVAQVTIQVHLNGLVRAVTRTRCDNAGPFQANVEDEVRSFLPSDARRVSGYVTPDGWPGATFRSAQLAAAFPGDAFEDCASGKQLPRGTVSFARSPGGGTWLVALGQCL